MLFLLLFLPEYTLALAGFFIPLSVIDCSVIFFNLVVSHSYISNVFRLHVFNTFTFKCIFTYFQVQNFLYVAYFNTNIITSHIQYKIEKVERKLKYCNNFILFKEFKRFLMKVTCFMQIKSLTNYYKKFNEFEMLRLLLHY